MASTEDRVHAALNALGVGPASTLMMHSSFRGLSRQGYRAEDFLGALVQHVPAGTVLLPAMSWRSVNPQNPYFDELETPSITGILGEVFRRTLATRRSLHPTHSVAGRGVSVDYMLSEHHLDDTPCSQRSPFGRLVAVGGSVLLLGVGMERCTLIHHFEERIAADLYLEPALRRERYTCRDRFGRNIEMYTRRHLRLERDFQQFLDALEKRGQVLRHSFDGVPAICFRARDMADLALPWLELQPDAALAHPDRTRVVAEPPA